MEPPANSRRRVLVLALSKCKSRALMVQDPDGLWHLPNSHLHWPVGARAREPQHVAAVLLHRATLGILGDVTDVRAMLGAERNCRSRLPAGGFVYTVQSEAAAAHVESAVTAANRVRRFLFMHLSSEHSPVQMVSIAGVLSARARARFGGDTVEACTAMCLDRRGGSPRPVTPESAEEDVVVGSDM